MLGGGYYATVGEAIRSGNSLKFMPNDKIQFARTPSVYLGDPDLDSLALEFFNGA